MVVPAVVAMLARPQGTVLELLREPLSVEGFQTLVTEMELNARELATDAMFVPILLVILEPARPFAMRDLLFVTRIQRQLTSVLHLVPVDSQIILTRHRGRPAVRFLVLLALLTVVLHVDRLVNLSC